MSSREPDPIPSMSCEEIRAFDRFAIEVLGIPGIVLMENAARSVADLVAASVGNKDETRIVILCGPGNNGGDGYAAARHLLNAGFCVTLVRTSEPAESAADAVANFRICKNMGMDLLDAETADGGRAAILAIEQATVIIDALLGSGSRGAPRGVMIPLILAANRTSAARIAIDIPTGLQADSGEVLDPCFRADTTITLLAPKLGFVKSAAREVLGKVALASIGVGVQFGRRSDT